MHAYLLALEIEPVVENKVYVALPLHCTIVPWVYSEHSPAKILSAITPIVYDQPPIELISGAPDLFGADKDVPVNRIKNAQEVQAFHSLLLEALETTGIKNTASQWVGSNYVPHVTRQKSGRFEEGQRYLVTRVYLVEALRPDQLQQKRIVTKLFLGKNVK